MKRKELYPKVYDLRNYDLVYVVLKPNSAFAKEYHALVKFDGLKKKHYIKGKLIAQEQVQVSSSSVVRYPKFRTVSLIPKEDIAAYQKNLNEAYILHIHFAVIDCITLPFDAFDWIS
jgi:hypothetical protein